MKSINRAIAPPIKEITSINFDEPLAYTLENGIPVYEINVGTQEIVKIEFVFKAGSYFQEHPLVASTCSNLLTAGSKKYTSSKLAERADYYGAFLNANAEKDTASVALFSLNKHLNKTIQLLHEVVKKPEFPEKELEVYVNNKKQEFAVNSQKVNFIARQNFPELLFGKTHPYGKKATIEDYNLLKQNLVIDFFNERYTAQNCKIIISGKITDLCRELIPFYFGEKDWRKSGHYKEKKYPIFSTKENLTVINTEKPLQSAIRIGKILFNKTHEDFIGMQLVNTILGGYFGSRLMTNIREDKGYTYGIGSGIISLKESGFFFITSEVGVEVTKETIKEIFKEIKILRTELISTDELETVKNYMLGQLLRGSDGAFALSEAFVAVNDFGLKMDYYQKYTKTLNAATPEYIKNLAKKHLNEEEMIQLVVGKL